jgi:surface antigen
MKIAILAVTAGALFLTGCNHAYYPVGPRENVGAVSGAIAGGVIGNQVGSGSGRVVATAIGALAGGLIGAEIGRSLDERDRQKALAAEYRALEFGRAGRPVAWRNENSGIYGEVVTGPGYEVNSLDCRDYTHTIYIDGRARIARGTACRQPDGTWRIVS